MDVVTTQYYVDSLVPGWVLIAGLGCLLVLVISVFFDWEVSGILSFIGLISSLLSILVLLPVNSIDQREEYIEDIEQAGYSNVELQGGRQFTGMEDGELVECALFSINSEGTKYEVVCR